MQPKPPVKDCIEQYKSYVDQFVEQVLPAMPAGSPLSFDHYPAFDVPGDGSYDNYSAAGAGGSRAGYRAPPHMMKKWGSLDWTSREWA